MPPTLFIALAYPWYKLAHAVFPYYVALAVYSGGIAGYISYDMTHYFLHHRTYILPMPLFLHFSPPLPPWRDPISLVRTGLMCSLPSYWKELKRYHLAHHYKNFELGYGVTSKFWDTIFGMHP